MSVTPIHIEQSDPPRSPRETLPTMYDLPSEYPEEPGLPDEFHDLQSDFLRYTFRSKRYLSSQVFIGTDLNVYYDVHHPLWHKRPDWFVAVDVPRLYDGNDLRRSYVIWQEGVSPLVVIELLSPGTAEEDLGENLEQDSSGDSNGAEGEVQTPPSKWMVYEQILRVPYYIVFERYTNQLRFFQLVGARYQEQELNEVAPQIWIAELELGLGLWEGEYEDLPRLWLRWCDGQGNWIPTPAEVAQAAQQRAEAAEQQSQEDRARAEAAAQQAQEDRARAEAAERAIATAISRLLGLGFSVEQVAETLGLSVEEVHQRTQP